MRATTIAILCLLLFAATAARAGEFLWRDDQGKAVPDSDSRKSKDGFAGMVLITSDADWEKKWASPDTPAFTTTEEVSLGETVTALIFFVNAATDAQGMGKVLCDIVVTRPDGSVSSDAKAQICAEGRMDTDRESMRLVDLQPQFVGEAGDPPGTWTIAVRLTDSVRRVALPLSITFEYRKP